MKKNKKTTLYLTIILPSILISLLGTILIIVSMTENSKKIMTKLDAEKIHDYPDLMFSVIEEERLKLKSIADFINVEN